MVPFKKMIVTFKSPMRLHLQKIRFDRTMSPPPPSKPNKLPQERNSYLILFPRYSGESFKMGHLVYTGCPIFNNALRFLENYGRYEKIFSNSLI